jgi:hypothetical protein
VTVLACRGCPCDLRAHTLPQQWRPPCPSHAVEPRVSPPHPRPSGPACHLHAGRPAAIPSLLAHLLPRMLGERAERVSRDVAADDTAADRRIDQHERVDGCGARHVAGRGLVVDQGHALGNIVLFSLALLPLMTPFPRRCYTPHPTRFACNRTEGMESHSLCRKGVE